MNSQLSSAIRTLLVLLGSYFIGQNFFGLAIDNVLWEKIVGIALVAGSVLWSLFTKSITEEVWQGAVRHLITFIAGIFLAKGVLTNEMWQSILAVLGGIAPWLQSAASLSLNSKLKTGKVEVDKISS
jgi:hypothetical protein